MGTPIVVVEGIHDPGPYLTIRVLCSDCGRELTTRIVDSREGDVRDAIQRHATVDAYSALAHVCLPPGTR